MPLCSFSAVKFLSRRWLVGALVTCVIFSFGFYFHLFISYGANGIKIRTVGTDDILGHCQSITVLATEQESNTTSGRGETHLYPNIVYMLADDLGYGDVGYNGGVALTPNIDAMAAGPSSIRFDRFYSGGPTCSPTRGTILTGRNHNRYCIWHADLGNPNHDLTCPSLMPLPDSEVTVAEILQDVGYHNVIYGKWHVGDLKPLEGGNPIWRVANPTTHGFQEWLVTERHTSNILPNCRCSKDYNCSLDGHKYTTAFCRNYWFENPLTHELEKCKLQVFEDSHFIVDRFEEFLLKRNKSKPFYAQLSFHNVHSQFLATPYWIEVYEKKGVFNGNHRHFLGAISQLDESVGRVRNLLKEHGLANNTMVWFSSDNGPQDYEPGTTGGLRGRKGTIFEGGIRVPGIIEWPGVIDGNRRSSVPIVTSDFLPTIAEIVGAQIPRDRIIDGLSILKLLRNSSECTIRGSNIKFAFKLLKGDLNQEFSGAVVGDRYKYWAKFNNRRIVQQRIFDLTRDKEESRDISRSMFELKNSMRNELHGFLKSVTKDAQDIGCLSVHDRRDKCG